MSWYGVRHVIDAGESDEGGRIYEERITLWQAESFDDALALAEAEAADYVDGTAGRSVGLFQAYRLTDAVGSGAEVFSLMRTSSLQPVEYLDRFFDTGDERTQHVD